MASMNLLLASVLAGSAWSQSIVFPQGPGLAPMPLASAPSPTLATLGDMAVESLGRATFAPQLSLAPLLSAQETRSGSSTPSFGERVVDDLANRRKLGADQLAWLEGRLERAAQAALSPNEPLEGRLVALTTIAQVALLSYHDPAPHRSAEQRILRLRNTLSRVRAEAERALATVVDHIHRPLTDESRAFMRESLARSPFLG